MEAEESGGGGVMDCYDCKAKSVCAAVVQRGSVMCLMNRMRYCGTHAEEEPRRQQGDYQDVANIKEDIVQRLCTKPYFGGAFTVLKPIAWAMQQDDTYPYYFGACSLTCTAPAMTQDTEMEELV